MTYADLLTEPRDRPARDGLLAVLVGGAVVAAVLLTVPFADVPYNDDWSYAFTVQHLARTGHLAYNGWATASLVVQAYWGAAWARAFGFSFTVLRVSILPVAAAAVSLVYLLGRRAGLRPAGAVFAALLVGWSPLYLPVAATFMTDAPGLFFTCLALYVLVRSADARSTRAAVAWLAAGVVVGGVGGTGRQIVWVVPLAVVPYVAWVRRGERPFIAAAAIGWVAVVVAAGATIRWFDRQPLTIPEPSPFSDVVLAVAKPSHYLASVVALGLTVVWVILPAMWPLARGPWGRWGGRRGLAAAGLMAVFVAIVLSRHAAAVRVATAHHELPNADPAKLWPYAMAPWVSNTLDFRGVMGGAEIAGDRPVMLPAAVRVGFAVVVFAATALLLVDAARLLTGGRAAGAAAVDRFVRPGPGRSAVPALTVFAVAYLALLLPRSARDMTFDRYVLPLMPCLAIPLLLRGQRQGGGIPKRAWAALGLYAAFAVASTQEVTALGRARAAAVNRLVAAGVSRTAIHGGFEVDFQTQMMDAGHINDPRLHPRWAYRRRRGSLPAVVPEYTLEASPPSAKLDSEATRFGSVQYWSLVPPFRRRVYIDRYRDPWWLDPARAATRPARKPDFGLPDVAVPGNYDEPDTPVPAGANPYR